MVIHLIHTAVTRKIYLDIWRNIKNLPSKLVYSYSIFIDNNSLSQVGAENA